jgi:glycosyltransferase involved in cell wall biosynthesis
MRLHLDCTHTRLQTASVGITRVVRGLARGLQEAGPEVELQLAAYHRDGFRRAPSAEAEPADGGGSALYRLSSQPWTRRLVKRVSPTRLQVGAWRLFSRSALSRYTDALPRADIRAGDIVIAGDAGWNYDLWSCVERASGAGARIVSIVYDLIPVNHPAYCAPAHRLLFADWLRGALRWSDALLCISEATRAELARYCAVNGLRCPPSAAFRLGGDPALARGAPGEEPLRASLRATIGRGNAFLTVGSLEPRKNHALMLEAFEALWRGGADASLVIVGRPVDGMQALLARIQGHAELGRRLHLLTDCGDAELAALYRGARGVVLASLAEGFGLPLTEARERGCEVIASRIAAFEELADAGVRLFTPGSAGELAALVAQVAATKASAAAMPAFSWRDSARQFLDGIARTCGARSP